MLNNTNATRFNYIVTIHNKQDIIETVILNIIKCMNTNSALYPILDGCSDNSEAIIDSIIIKYPDKLIKKIYSDDVHELKAINTGLKSSDQIGTGFNIIIQDDVVIKTYDIEQRIINLYKSKNDLGIVSFRHGFNISRSLIKKKTDILPITNHIENIRGHNYKRFAALKLGYFTYREIAVKSPICIPFNLINAIGLPDEIYAPWDDMGFCYSAVIAGFNNGVYAIDFESDISWGTTRTKNQKISISEVERKNISIFKSKHSHDLQTIKKSNIYNNKIYLINKFDTAQVKKTKFFKGIKTYAKDNIKYFINVLFRN